MRDITELPHDIFLLVISRLSPRTCVRCRAVSRRWHEAFTSEVASLLLLRWNFPRCRELRLATAAAALTASTLESADIPANLKAELADIIENPRPWFSILADVARRYYYLNQAKPRVIEKLEMTKNNRQKMGSLFSFWPVAPWSRFLRFLDKTSDFHHPDPEWSYSQEDGLLVYPAKVSAENDGYVYHIIDLATNQQVPVPFDVRSKHIRRVRLASGVLIIEWAEALPYHQLNALEVVHRHFVTAFDVIRKPSAKWCVEFRSEWEPHFLGLPLNRSDRFFSTHTATHYAVYFWQPNRSLYHIEPIEQLAVWDISSPSPYRPSANPKADKRPNISRTTSLPTGLWNGSSKVTGRKLHEVAGSEPNSECLKTVPASTTTTGPRVIRRMAWRELDFYGVRQRATPQLRGLMLDGTNLYVIEEEHRWAEGQHSSLNPPRVHLVRCTGIPVIPAPPCPESSSQPSYPAAASSTGYLSMTELANHTPTTYTSTTSNDPVHGPVWVDACGADGDVNMSFCRRVADADGLLPTLTDIASLPTGDSSLDAQTHLTDPLRIRSSSAAMGWPWALAESGPRNAAIGIGPKIRPGLAPCWRHEDFPYLTVTQIVDFAAGVRVTARDCFMLETMSVHVRPAVSVEGTGSPSDTEDDAGRRRRSNVRAHARCKELPFPDGMWSELMAKGHIAGDERWIVGEDYEGRITVVRF
ncbi:hypothetical protein N656DRAFT_841848 [Canariomyces notabilis]|uniref:F-box domain-containing protein n=1 Tax=Canariomyces notabilis TaxID=2074819 RepID=A0AAN6TKZ2_9PEZI|nr:hypothetical protein N656DRAFT_841848 [Canariomyces arenarius]